MQSIYDFELAYTGGTGNILNHIKLEHSLEFLQTPEKVINKLICELANKERVCSAWLIPSLVIENSAKYPTHLVLSQQY